MYIDCPYLQPDIFGDICHAGIGEECLNPFSCTAVYDTHGKPLLDDENGLDNETFGFY